MLSQAYHRKISDYFKLTILVFLASAQVHFKD